MSRLTANSMASLRKDKILLISPHDYLNDQYATPSPSDELSRGREAAGYWGYSEGESRTVIALDSSALPLAVTSNYWVVAFCLAIVIRGGGSREYKVLRLGPNLITVKRLEKADDPITACRNVRELVERETITRLIYSVGRHWGGYESENSSGGYILLVDGTLESVPPLDLSAAISKDLMVIGVSKTTSMRLEKAASLSRLYKLDSNQPKDYKRTLVTKLSPDGLPLRVDVAYPDVKKALSALTESDILVRGYPDTLRIAHYSCLISRPEEEAIKTVLVSKGVTLAKSLDTRRAVLGLLKVRR